MYSSYPITSELQSCCPNVEPMKSNGSTVEFYVICGDIKIILDQVAQEKDVFEQISQFFMQAQPFAKVRLHLTKGTNEDLRLKLKDHFELDLGFWNYLGPKEKNRILLEDGLTRIEYQNGMVEEVRFENNLTGRRIYPKDAMVEEGIFSSTGALLEGKRIQKGQIFYVNSVKELDNCAIDGTALVYGHLKEETDQKVRLFRKVEALGCSIYTLHQDQSPEYAAHVLLQHIAQNKSISASTYQSIIDSLQESAPFIQSLTQPHEACEGGHPIFNLNSELFFITLKKAHELGLSIDLKTSDSSQDKNLLEVHFETDIHELIQLMIIQDPSILTMPCDGNETLLVRAFLDGDGAKVKMCLEACNTQGIPLSDEEKWYKQIYENDLNFSAETFLELTPEMKNRLYSIAHAFNRIEFIARLNQLGMVLPKIDNHGRSFGQIPIDLNAVEREKAIQTYFSMVRSEGRIFTESEFVLWNEQNQYQVIERSQIPETGGKAWVTKGKDFSRVRGCEIIAAATKKLGTRHIRTPQKVIVVPDQNIDVELNLDMDYRNRALYVERCAILSPKNCVVYAEKVEGMKRKISREEMEELIAVIQEVGYGDLWDFNFIVGKDGIYFIDTEKKSFKPQWDKISYLLPLLDPKDHEWFDALIVKKAEIEKQHQKPLNKELLKQRIKIAEQAGYFSDTKPEFKVRIL